MAAGLGGGSGNAATTLLGLNELFGQPSPAQKLVELAAALGSDVPFFLQDRPALATGLGERVTALERYQECLRANEAVTTLMAGSGSTTFALARSQAAGDDLAERFKEKFGQTCRMAVVAV